MRAVCGCCCHLVRVARCAEIVGRRQEARREIPVAERIHSPGPDFAILLSLDF